MEGIDSADTGLEGGAVERHVRPLITVVAIAEGLAAGVVVIQAVPLWMATPFLVGVPLASWCWSLHRRNVVLRRLLTRLDHYDRRYDEFTSRWVLGPRTGDHLAGTHHARRSMIARRPIRNMTWNVVSRSDDDISYSGGTVTDRAATRSGPGVCTFLEPHHALSKFSFRIRFEPPLRPGEALDLSYTVHIPRFRSAHLAALRNRPAPTVAAPGEAEFCDSAVSFPIERYVKEVVIPVSLGTTRHGLQVLLRDQELREEAEIIERNGDFTVHRATWDGTDVWILRLERQRPPIKTTYRAFWEPPPA